MSISDIGAANPLALAQQGARTTTTSTSDLGEGHFLRMLTIQLSNQDPTQPMDSEKFLGQLATLAQLEQSTNSQKSLDQLVQGIAAVNNAAMVGMVGREVTAVGDTVDYTAGDELSMDVELAGPAAGADIVLLDEDGQVVASHSVGQLDAGRNPIDWTPVGVDGKPLEGGRYRVQVEAWDHDRRDVPCATMVRGLVDEVRFRGGQVLLSVNGVEMSVAEVSEVR